MRRTLVLMAIALIIAVSNTATAVNTEKDTIKLEQNYKLRLDSINASGPVRSAVLELIPGDKSTVLSGDSFSLYHGNTLVLKGKLDAIFVGALSEIVQITDLVQYDEDGTVILTMDKVLLFKTYHPPVKIEPTTETFGLKQGYELNLLAVDNESKLIWIQLVRANGDLVDDRVVGLSYSFSMYDSNALVVNATFDQLYMGAQSYIIQLKDLSQYNRNTGKLIFYQDRVMMVFPYP